MRNRALRIMLPLHGLLLALAVLFPSTIQAASQKVWQMGTFDESPQEFNAGEFDYSNPAHAPVFTVGKSDPAKDWYAYQPGSGNGAAGFRPHPFTVKFDLSGAPKGVFSLKVGLLTYPLVCPDCKSR